MCGRITLKTSPEQLAEQFRLPDLPDLAPRYNIAPTQSVAAVRADGENRRLVMLQWGLVPSWSKDPKAGARCINARGETADSKPIFRAAFRRQRCLVLADGFYEWKAGAPPKQPYYIHAADGRPFAMAGLWEHWSGAAGPIESCTILTTEPNATMAPLHDRMPVILAPEHYDFWLDPKIEDVRPLKELLTPCPNDLLELDPVSRTVNRPTNDSPKCIEPVDVQGTFAGF